MWISSMHISDELIWTAMAGLVEMKPSLSSRAPVSPNRSLRRCDSRLNEITERASADRCEAESLAKKYEEKYKQAGGVASKLLLKKPRFVIYRRRNGAKQGSCQDEARRIVLITSN